jgi:hypothetical protein
MPGLALRRPRILACQGIGHEHVRYSIRPLARKREEWHESGEIGPTPATWVARIPH